MTVGKRQSLRRFLQTWELPSLSSQHSQPRVQHHFSLKACTLWLILEIKHCYYWVLVKHKGTHEEHQFGFGTERYFWSFVVALVLFSLGGLFALYEGIDKLRHPHELESPIWGFVVLGIALILEGFSLRTAIIESRDARKKLTYRQFIRQAKHPELPVVLLEDTGALLGLMFALAGLSLAAITGNSRFDSLGSIAVGILLIVIAYILAVEMKSLLIGESVTDEDEQKIRAAILDGDEVTTIIHLRTQHLGPDDILLGVKVETSANTAQEISAAIDVVEARVRAAVPTVRTIYIEPDIKR